MPMNSGAIMMILMQCGSIPAYTPMIKLQIVLSGQKYFFRLI